MSKSASTKTTQEAGNVDVRDIDILELLPNPYQPESRVDVDPEIVKKFALSFQEHGLIQTPVVRVSNGRYEIADGWLRRAGFLYNMKEFGLEEYRKMQDCQNEPTCDRSHFYTDGQGGYVCDHKVSAQEEVPDAV